MTGPDEKPTPPARLPLVLVVVLFAVVIRLPQYAMKAELTGDEVMIGLAAAGNLAAYNTAANDAAPPFGEWVPASTYQRMVTPERFLSIWAIDRDFASGDRLPPLQALFLNWSGKLLGVDPRTISLPHLTLLALSAVMVFVLSLSLFKNQLAAALVAVIFAAVPVAHLHWYEGRMYGALTFFAVAAVMLALRLFHPEGDQRKRRRLAVGALFLLCFPLGLATHQLYLGVAAGAGLAILLAPMPFKSKAAWIAGIGVACAATVLLQPSMITGVEATDSVASAGITHTMPPPARLVKALAWCFAQFLLPYPLAVGKIASVNKIAAPLAALIALAILGIGGRALFKSGRAGRFFVTFAAGFGLSTIALLAVTAPPAPRYFAFLAPLFAILLGALVHFSLKSRKAVWVAVLVWFAVMGTIESSRRAVFPASYGDVSSVRLVSLLRENVPVVIGDHWAADVLTMASILDNDTPVFAAPNEKLAGWIGRVKEHPRGLYFGRAEGDDEFLAAVIDAFAANGCRLEKAGFIDRNSSTFNKQAVYRYDCTAPPANDQP